jgi:hypothetical protein
VIAVVIWLGDQRSPPPAPKGPYQPTEFDLRWYAEKAVRASLKAPSTAKFPSEGRRVMEQSKGEYLVTGTVDAENSFGAKLRSNWKVLMIPTIEGRDMTGCTLIYVQVGEQIVLDRRAEHYQR